MSVFLAVTPAEAASCRGYRVPLVHIAYAVGDGGRLLRAALTVAFGLCGEAAAAVIGRTFCAALFLTALTLTLLHRAGPWPLIAAGVTFLRLLLMRREEKAVAFPRAKR